MILKRVDNRCTENASANTVRVMGAAAAIVISLLIILGLTMNTSRASANVVSTPQSSGSSLASNATQSSQPSCDLSWKVVPSANTGTESNQLASVSAYSANDVWAVGQIGIRETTLTEHWDGSSWTIFPSPNAGTSQNYLSDVADLGPNDAWAVGLSVPDEQFPRSFMLHWNGTAWSQVVVPSPGTHDNVLSAIEAISATDIWASGAYTNEANGSKAFMLHWNGSTWSLVAVPGVSGGVDWDRIESIKALSANDIWAAGYYRPVGGVDSTLVLHWDGTAWSRIPSPNPGPLRNFLYGIAPVSSSNIWAFGNYTNDLGDTYYTLILHWNGSAWSQFASPSPGDLGNQIGKAIAFSASDIWTVGAYYSGSSTEGLVLHWDGTTWTQDATASLPGSLAGIDGISPTNIWAVGLASGRTRVEHYSTDCPLPTQTPTATPTRTPIPTSTSTPVPPRCVGERFTDVCPGDYFFEPVISLNDAGIVAGYNSSPPCLTQAHVPCYLPYNNVTRGQSAKIVALSAGFTEPVSGQLFEDIPPGSTFYDYVGRLANRGIVSGYRCGGAGEPCGPGNLPYYRQNNTVTRGQLSKMGSQAFGYTESPSGQTFEDVPVGSTFYAYVQRMAARGIINGYPCGSAAEPCIPSANRPYFRPGSPVTRGQTAKILYIARSLITPTPTITATSLPTATSTGTPTPTETATSVVR